ncbi:MAG: hypothetical protein UY92_C0006G0055 [Candidatus Magasanikbacteria bacterium GW2011_GWA2_56_11]|uniref:Metallo-beta-lactamase domain-containing protein n=1 Tax=Candidatus Magasanikbacteria bacterium GW2011_GWA2_56_11 TaxID=1619044 RepID=A0A0G2BAG2_9BACT|nr:MAG: hypothetical protein UY92_C0006G0055 [Candidatus Magasanikbacteria bacterium GW2011_GWA2_56_11]
MRITKFGHSCLLVEEDEARILIDPGSWTSAQNGLKNLDVILITHEHNDHCDLASIQALLAGNPGVVILTNSGVKKKLAAAGIAGQILEDGASTQVKGVKILACGRDHAVIYETIPPVANTGYLIAERFFAPGDTVTAIPPQPVEILALPVVAPWTKLAECLDYARKIKPQVCFPVHDGMAKEGAFDKHPQNILPGFGIEVVIPQPGVPMDFQPF